jgi:hypothetical protein
MPGQRPFQTHSLDKLFLLAREHWDNIRFLEVILDELAHRTTPGARARHGELEERLSHLRPPCAGGTAQGSGGVSVQDRKELEQEALARLRADNEAVRARVVELERVLRQADETIRRLRRDVADASVRNGNPIFRRVGLDESCPDFVVKAVRTAYRKTLHPDARPAHEKDMAENRFKEAESVFDAIYALRKL